MLAACRLVLRSARRFYPCLLSCVSSRCVSVLRAAIASRHCVPFSSLTSLVSVRLRSSPFVIRWWRFSCGAVSFCCSLIFIRPPPRYPARFSLFPSFYFSYVRSPWRLACRLVLSSRHAVSFSGVSSVVPPVVLSARPVSSSRLVASYGRRFVLLFARSRLAWAWRSCLAFSCRLVFSLASRSPSLRPVVAFRSSSHRSRLVLVPSSRHLCLPVGVSCPFSCLVPVFAPFRFAVRSFLTHSIRLRSSVPVSMRRGWGASWPWIGGGLLSSSHPSAHCSRSLFSHSLRDDYGEGWIWSAVSCCSSLVYCLFMSHRSSHPIGPSLSLRSNPLTHEARKRTRRRRRRWRTGNRTRRPYETKRREARRDEDGAETIHGEQASNKTTDETKKHETQERDAPMMRTNGRRRGAMRPGCFIASTTTRTR